MNRLLQVHFRRLGISSSISRVGLVKPIHKISTQKEMKDLRPITILPILSMVMGSDMYKQNLKNILQHLAAFEKAPKEIKERQVTEWFRFGEQLFEELHNLGVSAGWSSSAVKNKPEVPEIATGVTRNQSWLQSFVTTYPNIRLDLDGGFPAGNICRVRSGLEFLLRGFVDVNPSFNKVLKDLEELGELDEFDSQLKVWVETGHRPEFFSGDKHSNIPSSHWWWF